MPAVTEYARPSDPVSSIVSGAVAEVDEDITLQELAEELAADEIGAVLVRDPHGVVGLASERDLVVVLSGGRDPADVRVADVMTTDLVWARPDATIREVGELMRDADVRHIPVGDGRIARGVVSIRDILAVLLRSAS
ncbi:MAG TPA: CBS domain-containing protein [Pseudonocardia sp.]|nr:CBS domain-containing protein [Pseudonocardia sp.]